MTTQVTVVVPSAPVMPRGAVWVGKLIDTFNAYRVASAATNDVRTRARHAAEVRRHADRLSVSDPGMAADLRAAVDRYLG